MFESPLSCNNVTKLCILVIQNFLRPEQGWGNSIEFEFGQIQIQLFFSLIQIQI